MGSGTDCRRSLDFGAVGAVAGLEDGVTAGLYKGADADNDGFDEDGVGFEEDGIGLKEDGVGFDGDWFGLDMSVEDLGLDLVSNPAATVDGSFFMPLDVPEVLVLAAGGGVGPDLSGTLLLGLRLSSSCALSFCNPFFASGSGGPSFLMGKWLSFFLLTVFCGVH